MYRLDPRNNQLEKLEQRLFKDLSLKEREHLQEWIVKSPDVLGEELLIIQKEFDGFNDTAERLDLLALDKEGRLVIIENKLDDSGRDVVWQALKYTSYCSTLSTSQIIRIYQTYLDRSTLEDDAKSNILEFLELEDESELLLNQQDQRVVLVANKFRKEVTSTVLWLRDHDIEIQCFRTIPYSMGNEVFLQIEQIIPLPETHEYMIDAREKEKEEQNKSKTVEESRARLLKFWKQLKVKLSDERLSFLDRVNASSRYSIGFWKGSAKFAFCIGRDHYRVEMYFSRDAEKKQIDAMSNYKEEIDSSIGGPVIWERLENKKASRIKYQISSNSFPGEFAEEDGWDQIINWYVESMTQFYETLSPIWDEIH